VEGVRRRLEDARSKLAGVEARLAELS
jgi:hypothetical protein